MNDLLKFWDYIKSTLDEDELNGAIEDFEFDDSRLQKSNLSKLSKEEIDDLFGDLIEFTMDSFGIDNYGDIYEILKNRLGMDDERIGELLEC